MREKNKSLIRIMVLLAVLLALLLAPASVYPVYATDNSVPAATSVSEFEQQLSNDIEDRQTNFTIHYVGNASGLDIKSVLEDVLSQDDYLRYTIQGWQCSSRGTTSAADLVFSVNYWETKEQVDYVTQTVNGILANIITTGMNDHQKEKAIHDYIVLHVTYDESYAEHSAYAALTLGKTVCQGYALLTYKMLSSAGIENKIVEGTAGGSNHSWNLVKLDGNWYHLDVTWDDPIPDKAGRVLYNYYNLTDTEIARTHTWTNTYPAAQTSYFQTLDQLMQNSPDGGYQDLIKGLNLQYLMPENTANSYDDLKSKIRQAFDIHASTLSIRYLAGGQDANQDTKNILNALASAYPSFAGATWSISDYIPGNISGDVIISLAFTYSSTQGTSHLSADSVVQIAPNPNDGDSAGVYIGLENISDSFGNLLPSEKLSGFSLQLDYDSTALQVLDVFDEQKLGLTTENISSVPGKLVITYNGPISHDALAKLLFLPIALTGSSQIPTNLAMHFSMLQDQNSANISCSDLVTVLQRGKILNENNVTSLGLQDAVGGLQYLAKVRSAGTQLGEVNLINMGSIISHKEGDKTLNPSVKDIIALLQQLAGSRDASFVCR